jgi:hypothetical protein
MKRCYHCGGRFGLIRQRHLWKQFCRKRCKENYLASVSRKVEATKRQWLPVIAKPS